MSFASPLLTALSSSSSPGPALLVLISGNGTNLQAIIDACGTPALPPLTRVARVVSNRRDAYGLIRAEKSSIPTTYHNLVRYKKSHPSTDAGILAAREDYDRDLASLIVAEHPTLVVCAGWMHILSAPFIQALDDAHIPIINLHPALPGQFNGAGAIQRAWTAFQQGEITGTGVMVHRVISEVDMGEPLVVREVPIDKGMTEHDLEQRIHEIEWPVIVEGTKKALEEVLDKEKQKAAEVETAK